MTKVKLTEATKEINQQAGVILEEAARIRRNLDNVMQNLRKQEAKFQRAEEEQRAQKHQEEQRLLAQQHTKAWTMPDEEEAAAPAVKEAPAKAEKPEKKEEAAPAKKVAEKTVKKEKTEKPAEKAVEVKAEKTAEKVAEIYKEQGAGKIVLGLPKNMDGSSGFRVEHTMRFKELLEGLLPGVEIVLYDERMTTLAAAQYMNITDVRGKKRKNTIDTLAAKIILQDYLDSQK